MEKVKITPEQEEALKDYKTRGFDFDMYLRARYTWTNSYKPLKDFKENEFALLLVGHYEIKQEFKVGDWVLSEMNNYMKVVNVYHNGEISVVNDHGAGTVKHGSKFTKIEDKIEIALLELGRIKPEFKIGDKITNVNFINKTCKNSETFMNEGKDLMEDKGVGTLFIYPVESRLEVK